MPRFEAEDRLLDPDIGGKLGAEDLFNLALLATDDKAAASKIASDRAAARMRRDLPAL